MYIIICNNKELGKGYFIGYENKNGKEYPTFTSDSTDKRIKKYKTESSCKNVFNKIKELDETCIIQEI